MFHNIFEDVKKEKKKAKIEIIADIHEKNSMVLSELKSNEDIDLKINSLPIGDYLIGEVIIERKTINDLTSSLLTKRIFEQLYQMEQYEQKILIIEGKIENLYIKINPNIIRGFILSIISKNKIPIIFTINPKDTSDYLATLAKRQIKSKTAFSLHSKIPKTVQGQKQYILESFPEIGPKKAVLLLRRFNSLNNTFNASEEELKNILKGNAKKFKEILNSP
ncbi:3'-flap repair endonuclease Xpf [uncultured archaeon]|nr:3'-flap repair endonuclease Xpf [uncultured archaeon]